MERRAFRGSRVAYADAWTGPEVRLVVEELFEAFADRLPASRDADVVIKPNLNNDLSALTGNSVDLRVLDAALGALARRGYRRLTVADGSNVGVERRGINSFRRLRVDRVAARHGARCVDLNHDAGQVVRLSGRAAPRVAKTVLEADFLLSIPKIKTHVEAGLSCAMKNWVGVVVGQDKRQMHLDLGRNILALATRLKPHLILVDGLIGMEGNGPGDGDPVRLGRLLAAEDLLINDLVVARMVGLPVEGIAALRLAREAGLIDEALIGAVAAQIPVHRAIRPAPPRSALARAADARALFWLKRVARPITDRPEVAAAAHRLGVIQDVYAAADDGIHDLRRDAEACGSCRRCEDFCPTALPLLDIGRKTAEPDCVMCLNCWWVCPKGALTLEGGLGHLERQVARYKGALEQI